MDQLPPVLLTASQAIERAETLRETAYAALAEIPRKLEFINSLTRCLRGNVGLYQAGDAVFVALFGALTQIIDELRKGKGSKCTSTAPDRLSGQITKTVLVELLTSNF